MTPRSPEAARIDAARRLAIEGVARDLAESFPGITRLGGQVVAALYLADAALSMDELSDTLGRAKSNVFANLRGLLAAGIVTRRRREGERCDEFLLRGPYPDVIVGAYLGRLRRVVADKIVVAQGALEALGDARSAEALSLRDKLEALRRKYARFSRVVEALGPLGDHPIDVERALDALGDDTIVALAESVRSVFAKE